MRIGVISDTHGIVLPEVHQAFQGVSLIIHAGDIGGEAVIAELSIIARVVAIRGNVDIELTTPQYPDTRRFMLEGVDVFLCHQPKHARDITPLPNVIIYGHTHHALIEKKASTLWFNPGSAGKPKDPGAYTVGILTLHKGQASAEIHRLR